MRRFWSDTKGNIAVLFALAIVPVIGGIGAAIDYSMASAYRTDMQQALDSTALALTKILPADEETVNKVGMEYFLASMGNHNLSNLKLTITPENGIVTLKATGDYKPAIANILGAQQFEIGTDAQARWSLGKLEIALVLDVSLSMNSLGRIQALRTATVDLLNVLENSAKEPGDAKVSIVPFDNMVNVGYTYNTAPNWIRWDWWDANVGSCNMSMGSVPAGTWLKAHCETRTSTSSSCVGASGTSQSRCERNGGKWVTTTTYGVWTSTNRNQWAGCVYDRDASNNVLDTSPDGSNARNYPAAKCHSSTPPQAITALSHDWNLLRTRAQNLTPTGYTNNAIGLIWGWHTLSPTALYTEGKPYDTEDLTKYVILMTDGENTKNRYTEPGTCTSCATVDTPMSNVCTNIKDSGVKIYSIRLIDGNTDMIRNCASDPSMYYDVQNSGQLAAVFNSIGSEIASLHLSK
jgi:Flp pilus assembly protein TadG